MPPERDKRSKTPKDPKSSKSGIFIYKDGSIYDGEYKEDGGVVKHGLGKYSDFNSKSIYYGNWEKDKMNGKGKLQFQSGAYYEGNWVNNTFQGFGTFVWPDSSSLSGEWENNSLSGPIKYIYQEIPWIGQFNKNCVLSPEMN